MALKDITGQSAKTSRAFRDIAIGLSRNTFTNDAGIVKNDNSVKQSIRNLVMTAPGEKPFQPLIGSKTRALLFEPMDPFTIDAIRDEIINTINQYEPRVQLTEVEVIPFQETNKVNITVQYRIVGLPVIETISFVLQRPE